MAYNVPAVYDVLAARIRKCAAFPGPSKCGGEKSHKGAMRRLRFFVARAAHWAAKHIQSCYAKWCRALFKTIFTIF
jgi:hypothetical protein